MPWYETAEYEVFLKEDSFEIRMYKKFITAKVNEDSLSGSKGFNQIFNYISGDNVEKRKISMTTPVFNEFFKDEITTEFVMPSDFSESTLPKPTNKEIEFKEYYDQLLAVVTFSGSVTESKIKEENELLLEWIQKKDYVPTGNLRLARYNPPFIPPIFRRNEVMITVEKKNS